MNWKFWKSKQEFKPLVSEKLGAYSLWIRIPLAVLIGALLSECLYWIYEIAVIGINNTQVSDEARAAEKAVVLIGMAFGVVASIFKGATARSKGFTFWHAVSNLIILVYVVIEMLSVVKGRLSNQVLQDNARITVQNEISNIDNKIATLKSNYETAKKLAVIPNSVSAKKSGWQAIEAERQNQLNRDRAANAMQDQKKAGEELNKLLDIRSKIKPPAPTETSILGADYAKYMRIAGSALLILMSIVLSRFLGVIIESFGVHRSNKYVAQSNEAVEIKKYEAPIEQPHAPKAPARPVSPVAKPMQPNAPEMGDVEVPRAVKGAALATMLGMGGAQMPAFAAANDDAPVAVQSPANHAQNEPVVGVGVGMGGSSGGDDGAVEVKSATEPLLDAGVVGAVAVQKPRLDYAAFMRGEYGTREELREAMRLGE